MQARYSYRCYPNSQQRRQLARLFGSVRVVYNDALALCKKSSDPASPMGARERAASEKLPSNTQLQKNCITLAKKTPNRAWLSQVSAVPLQQSIRDLGVAYKNFFDSCSGKRQGKRVGYPRFKRKHNRQSARFNRNSFSFKGSKVYLAKIGNLKVRWSRKLPSEPSSVTVIKDRANRYFLSFVVEVEPEIIPAKNESVGADLGLVIFATLSSSEKVYAPDYSKLERKIRRTKRVLSRRKKGSKRREQTRVKLAKLTSKLAAVRKDFLDKLSTRLTVENQILCLEDLHVAGMLKNRKLARAISQAGWGTFRSMCEAKAVKYGRDVRIINRFEPTSQICAECGYKWGKLDLSVREITCINCHSRVCRDTNASRVIEAIGKNQTLGVGHTHKDKWTGSGHQTSTEAIHVELSTRLVAEEYVQLSLPFFSS